MAKMTKSVTFKNATIDFADRSICEYGKDETKTYKIDDILKEWSMIDGITFSLKQDDELPSIEDGDTSETEE